jgi:hypothetical protein
MNKAIAWILFGIISTGCTTRIVDFTAISTKNVDWSKAATFSRASSRVVGKDTAHIIIFIPTGVPNMKEAIDQAIESRPGGVALVDGVVYSKFWWIPYIYGQTSYVVEGTPLIDPALNGSFVAKSGATPPVTKKELVADQSMVVPVPSASNPKMDVPTQLGKLKELMAAGLLTEEEFEKKRQELVGPL